MTLIEFFYDWYKKIKTKEGEWWQDKLWNNLPFFFHKVDDFSYGMAVFINEDWTMWLINKEKILVNNADYVQNYYYSSANNIVYFRKWNNITFINIDGKIIFSKDFEEKIIKVNSFREWYASILYGVDSKKSIVINDKGEIVLNGEFIVFEDIYSDIVSVYKDWKYWYYDINNKKYYFLDDLKFIYPFYSDLALYTAKNTTFWYINKKGEKILENIETGFSFYRNKEYTTYCTQDWTRHILNRKGKTIKSYKDVSSLTIDEIDPESVLIRDFNWKHKKEKIV